MDTFDPTAFSFLRLRDFEFPAGVAVYGYGPATLRRVLRFREAVRLLRSGHTVADAAAQVGYADQSHLSRQVRELAGVPAGRLYSGAKRSIEVPSGSSTVA